ncbi:MAG: alpha-amylase [Ferruginibacter sp.]|nr:alpha-amylase [Ferruginibacter sp.]
MIKKTATILAILILHFFSADAQFANLYPTNWWTGMKWNKVQVLVHGSDSSLGKNQVTVNYPGVTIQAVHKLDNNRYLAIDLLISPTAKPGNVPLVFSDGGPQHTIGWPLKKRREGRGKSFAQGVHPEDLVYLLMPDRFSNGDESNDRVTGMRDQTLNRDSMYHRHGGDLQGVINHLDYLQDLGVTTVWMTPVIENDMRDRTEHGYAFTNHYKIDPRLGGNEAYKKLSDALHKKGMKLIQDAVYNHVGLTHFTVLDKPTKDWLHEWPSFTQTTYKDQVQFDPYAAAAQKKQMSDGWFVRSMPDLNQGNPYVANFLIQHALWSVEEFGVDGWRIDTYAYNDLPFMNRCNKALMDEYPSITMFGETWVHGVINQSFFCANNYQIPFKSNLQNTTDFQTLFYGIQPAINEKFGWTEGVNKLYTTAAQDFVYRHPENEVIFLDNHDLPRSYSVFGEDTAKYKMALGWLLTFRGIPQMYYGMEHLLSGFTNPDGLVRQDFQGGWKKDTANKFTAAGRTTKENEIFNYIKTLANFRKNSSALRSGKFMQYTPDDGLYVYFRYDEKETIMCLMNTSENDKPVSLGKDFSERTSGFSRGKNIVTGKPMPRDFSVPARQLLLLQLQQ